MSTQYPLVSVIMPAYNVEAYLEKAVQSVLDQTYTHFELIVADDGSADATVSKLALFSDERIVRLLHPQNKGYVENMNSLLRAAKGDFIMIQDADDYCTENRVQVLLDFLLTHTAIDMVGSSHVKVDERGSEEYREALTGSGEITGAFEKMNDPLPVLNGSVMFRRKIVDQGFFYRQLKFYNREKQPVQINRGQDDDWLFRISETFVIDNVKEFLYYYRINSSSMTLNPANVSYYSMFAGQFVRFLKNERMSRLTDSLEEKKWWNIEDFFMDKMRKLWAEEPAHYELHIAHKFLGQGKKWRALNYFFKALRVNPSNLYIWKKIIHVLLYGK